MLINIYKNLKIFIGNKGNNNEIIDIKKIFFKSINILSSFIKISLIKTLIIILYI